MISVGKRKLNPANAKHKIDGRGYWLKINFVKANSEAF